MIYITSVFSNQELLACFNHSTNFGVFDEFRLLHSVETFDEFWLLRIMRKHLMSSDCCICSTFMVAYLLIVCFTHRSSSVPLMAPDVTTCPTPGEAKCMSWWIAPTSCGGVWIIDLSMVLWSICNQSSLCHFNKLHLYFWFIIHWWFHKVRIKSATFTDVNSRGYIWNNWLLEINMLIEGCIFLSIQ